MRARPLSHGPARGPSSFSEPFFGDLADATGCATTLSRATAPFTPTFPPREEPGHIHCIWSFPGPPSPGNTGFAFPGISQPHLGRSRWAQQCPGCVSTSLGTASHGKPFHGEEIKENCQNPHPGSGLGHPWGCCPSFRGALWSLAESPCSVPPQQGGCSLGGFYFILFLV